mmetsp:Transcript_59928/g.69388  ORF Transcript_59928/g.69388 Transcript_59928/m.69388 type:complete len:341 (+) Transcript_59928:77-1099(+)
MLKRTSKWLSAVEPKFNFAGNTSAYVNSTGGVPFYGNIYAGRVHSAAWTPPPQSGSGLLRNSGGSLWDDPGVQAKIKSCPYFALCDQVLWHNMDPNYLDPGLLTVEEHQLLLLFSRAYFDKWRSIHTRPENPGPRLRITYGDTSMLKQICDVLGVDAATQRSLIKEFLMDDAGLIGMNPRCWHTAYLDPANRDQLSGRVLEYAGLSVNQRQSFFRLLDQMRRIRIRRKDKPVGPTGDVEVDVIPFHEGATLYDLHVRLGLEPYSGQLKAYDLVDGRGTPLTMTLQDEDTYFDFLVLSFYKANIQLATLQESMADDTDCTTRYSLTVEPVKARDAAIGQWF